MGLLAAMVLMAMPAENQSAILTAPVPSGAASAAAEGTVAPLPGPTPAHPPRAIEPKSWFDMSTYPAFSLKDGVAGRVGFRVEVNADGTVHACGINRSSGDQALDKTTCALVRARGRFIPAATDAGVAVAGVYYNSIVWRNDEIFPPTPSYEEHSMVVTDGNVRECRARSNDQAPVPALQWHAEPCRPLPFVDGYRDAAGRLVPKRVTTTEIVTVEDAPVDPPAH